MSAKHTPGPWEVTPSHHSQGEPTVWRIMPVASKGMGWTEGRYLSVAGCIAKEDADLIATAPELLEALEEAFPYINSSNADSHILELCRKVIAKSKGEPTE